MEISTEQSNCRKPPCLCCCLFWLPLLHLIWYPLGATTRTVMSTFVILGTLIGVLGVTLGVSLGLVLSYVVQDGYLWLDSKLHLDLMNQYFVNYLPSQVRIADVTLISSTAFVLCLLSTLYPAWRASKLQPAEILKHE